jgi:bifunctional UDP-N-acetylglucosamine pyrophosphorylase/glucosamine-1-phosphate N-acetyltransferase
MKLATVVLAAGEGTRMKSRLSKVLHPLAGQPVAQYALDIARELRAERTVFVIGKNGDDIRQALGERGIEYVYQAERLGTGHAAMQARTVLQGHADLVLVYYADMPLLRPESLRKLVENQAQGRTALTLLTLVHDDPMGFGRIVRASDGRVLAVVEEKVATPEQLAIRELNCGIYCFDAEWLWSHIDDIPLNPVAHEYYLTDMVGIAVADSKRVEAIASHDPDEMIGINTRIHLTQAEAAARRRINERLMLSGVTLQDASTAYIDASVLIGRDTTVLANTHLLGQTTVGEQCTIGPNAIVRDSTIGDNCQIVASAIEGAEIEDCSAIGPFEKRGTRTQPTTVTRCE